MKNIKVLTLLTLVLVLLLVACGGESNTETNTGNEEAETAVELAEEVKVADGGFAFQPPAGYEVNVESVFAEMTVADDAETQINIMGMPLMEGMGMDVLYEGISSEAASDETVTLGEREDVSINGLNGFAVAMSGDEEGVSVKGKMIIIGNDAQAVMIMAAAEESKWDDTVSAQSDAVLNTISLIDFAATE